MAVVVDVPPVAAYPAAATALVPIAAFLSVTLLVLLSAVVAALVDVAALAVVAALSAVDALVVVADYIVGYLPSFPASALRPLVDRAEELFGPPEVDPLPFLIAVQAVSDLAYYLL